MAAEGDLSMIPILTSSLPLSQTSAKRALGQTFEPTGGLTVISESINKVISEHDFPSCLSKGRKGSDHGDRNPPAWVTAASPTVIGWRPAAPPSRASRSSRRLSEAPLHWGGCGALARPRPSRHRTPTEHAPAPSAPPTSTLPREGHMPPLQADPVVAGPRASTAPA